MEKINSYEQPEEVTNDIDVLSNTQEETQNLKKSVEKPEHYGKTFLDYLYENPDTLQTIEWYLQEPETIETWSKKIENIWGEFSFGAMDPQLQEVMKNNPTLLQHMKTGLSLYFTDRLNSLSSTQLKDVSQVGISKDGLLWNASNFLGMFKNLTSFTEQMSAITYLTEGMDIYSKNLTSETDNNMASIEAFQSPEWFVRLLKKHTLTPWLQRPASFGSFDDYFNIEQQSPVDSTSIMKKLADSYNDDAHNLMTKVADLGPQVLASRNTLKSTFGMLYDQISQIVSIFNNGKPLSESIKGNWFEKPLNFIASIVGFGSVSRYETRLNIKNNTQTLPDSQKKWLLQAISFVENNPSTNISENFSKLFDDSISDIYEKYNIQKEIILQELPDQAVLKKGIERSLLTDDSFFIDSRLLQEIGLQDVDQYYTQDTNWKTILNTLNLSKYQKAIKDNLDIITEHVWLGKEWLMNPETIISMISEGKSKVDISTYLLSGLCFPKYPLTTVQPSSPIEKKQEKEQKKEFPPSSSVESLSVDEKAKITYDYLISLWYDTIQATAITANIKIESKFNTGAVGDKNLKHKAYWLCQRRAERFDSLKKYAKKHNKDWKNIYIQLDFMSQESTGRTKWYEEKFLSATTVEQATILFDQWYERSNWKSVDQRVSVAENYEKEFNIVAA